jgi:hypothetical protein
MKLGLGRLLRELGPERAVAVAHKLLKSINMPPVQRWAEEGYFVDGNLKNVWGSAKRLTAILPDEQAVKQFKDGLAAFAASPWSAADVTPRSPRILRHVNAW